MADADAEHSPGGSQEAPGEGKLSRRRADAYMLDHAKATRARKELQRKIDVDLVAWHDRRVGDITRADVKALLRREKARTAPISSHRLIALVSVIFRWALDEEVVGACAGGRTEAPRRGGRARAKS